nr:hypothetical protein [Cnaphalocrocis medinalis granulovirus]
MKLNDYLDTDISKRLDKSIYCLPESIYFIDRLYHLVTIINEGSFLYTRKGFEYKERHLFCLSFAPHNSSSEDDEFLYRTHVRNERRPRVRYEWSSDGEDCVEVIDEIDLRRFAVTGTNAENWPCEVKLQFWQVIALLNCCNVTTLKELKWCGYRALLTVLIYNSNKYHSDETNQWWYCRQNIKVFTVSSIELCDVLPIMDLNLDHIIGMGGISCMNNLPEFLLPCSYFRQSLDFQNVYTYVVYLWYRNCDYENRFFCVTNPRKQLIVTRCYELTKMFCYENEKKVFINPRKYNSLIIFLKETIDHYLDYAFGYYLIEIIPNKIKLKIKNIVKTWDLKYKHETSVSIFKYICKNQYKKL